MTKTSKYWLSWLLTVVMLLSLTPMRVLGANEENSDYVDVTTDPSPIASSDTYQITLREDIIGGQIFLEQETSNVASGETITFTVQADTDYQVTSVGWCTYENEEKGSLNELTANEDGTYSFVMPETDVLVGASFQKEPMVIGNKIGGDKATDWNLYMAIEDAFVYESTSQTSARLIIDKRFLEETEMTFTLELRQYGTGGYTVVGSQTYTKDDFQALVSAGIEDETAGTITVAGVSFDVDPGKSLEAGKLIYCVVKCHLPYWVDAIGDPVYRWTYTGDATVLQNGANIPEPIVWLYHLDANSYRGALIRDILDRLNIPYDTISHANLNQNIGYLVNWDGYEAVEDPYNSEDFDVEYILMGNLTETQLDDFLDGMIEANIRVNLKSVPTAWTASKTFAELFAIMAEEDEAFQALLVLDAMIYDAEQLDENIYGDAPSWSDFQAALTEALALLNANEEAEAQVYLEAYRKLLDAYLDVSGKKLLSGDLELILEEEEDQTYTISARLYHDTEGDEATFRYLWQDGSTGETIQSVAAEELYKVKLEITGTGDYYGEMTATLSVPTTPKYSITSTNDSISVHFEELGAVLNTPEPITCVAQLYLEDTLIQTLETENTPQTIAFPRLEKDTTYKVAVYNYNVVGRSNILEQDIVTGNNQEEINITLKDWVGVWENWQNYIYPNGAVLEEYPYLEEVWEEAYKSYIAAFYAVSEEFGQMVEMRYPDVASLKAYWYGMTDTKGVDTITVVEDDLGYTLSWLDADGKVLASDSYICTGRINYGLEGAVMYVFTANHLADDSEYKYFITMLPDMEGDETTPIAAHYHFQFGNRLDELLNYGQDYSGTENNIKNQYWYATMINANASKLAKYNVILGMHQAEKWSSLPSEGTTSSRSNSSGGGGGGAVRYAVNVEKVDNGTLSVTPLSAAQNTTVTITIKPNANYELDVVTVKDTNGEEVDVTKINETKYTFVMPDSRVTVAAAFREILASSAVDTNLEEEQEEEETTSFDEWQSPFLDVINTAYYYEAVKWAIENDVTAGVNQTTFAPDASCTRAQAVTFLWRVAGSPAPKSSDHPFEDVNVDDYYYHAVLWAVENGIAVGTSATTFSPDATVTRAQTVTFLWRAQASPTVEGNHAFVDVADEAYYAMVVQWAVENGIAAGTSEATFDPDANCSRAQMVSFLYRIYAD